MSKAVLISIRPKWCELIASGKKTIEVRKTRPKIETPFKCYIYCTSNGRPLVYGDKPCADGWTEAYTQTYGYSREEADKIWGVMNGKVIGEFVCDRIFPIQLTEEGYDYESEKETRLRYEEMSSYLNFKNGYGWHISNLSIYDVPKELGEFRRACHESLYCESCAMWSEQRGCGNAALQIARPPQSWRYVEELT